MAARVTRHRVSTHCAACALLALASSPGCSKSQPPPKPDDRISISQAGDTTVVTIEDREREPENPVCKSYCERLSACWYSVPSADPMLAPKDVLARCLAERSQCRTPTTEALCCGLLSACADFVRCQATGRDVVSTCEHAHFGGAR